jgi:hypothetical protein
MAVTGISGGVPLMDFSEIGNLPQVYKQAQIERARQDTLKSLGSNPGPVDYGQGAKSLLSAGDFEGGMKLAQLADANSQRQFSQGIQERQTSLQERQAEKPTFGVVSQDQYGAPQHGFINPNTQKVSPYNPPAQVGVGGSGADMPTGDDYLKTLDPARANLVKGISEGRVPYPSGMLLKTPYGQWLQTALTQYKPDLTAQDYSTIAQTRKNYTSGPSFQEIKAINTAIGHAAKLYDVSEKLGGSDVMPGYLNPVIQGVKNNFPSIDPAFQGAKKDYDALSETLSTEISKALNGGTPHVADKEHWRQIFAGADGPTQRRAAIQSAMGILEARTTPLKTGYEQGMKSAAHPIDIVSPANQQTFERLLTGKNPNQPQQPSPASQAGGQAPQAPQGAGLTKDSVNAARSNPQATLDEARQAIASGKDRNAIVKRLKQIGIDPSGL